MERRKMQFKFEKANCLTRNVIFSDWNVIITFDCSADVCSVQIIIVKSLSANGGFSLVVFCVLFIIYTNHYKIYSRWKFIFDVRK